MHPVIDSFSITAEMQRLDTQLLDLDRSIDARRALVDTNFDDYPEFSLVEEDFDNLSLASSCQGTCPDCRMGTPIHLKPKVAESSLLFDDFEVLVKSCSKTSLTDSAITSMSSCLTKDSRCAPKETNL